MKTRSQAVTEWERQELKRAARRRTRDARVEPEVVEHLRRVQRGRCAIPDCKNTLRVHGPVGPDKEVVDHCHRTGEVRGLLCSRCNLALGWFEKHGGKSSSFSKYLVAPPAVCATV